MNFALNKRQTISLFILLALVLVLPLALLLTRQRQEVRKKAAELGIIKITLWEGQTQAGGQKQPGDNFNITVKLNNSSAQEEQIRTAGVEFKFNPAVFTISQVACGSSLSSSAFAKVENDKIILVCYKTPGATGPSEPLKIAAGQTVDLGSFQATVKTTAPLETTEISSQRSSGGRTNIPRDVTLVDLSDEGTPGTYTISSPGVTPSPTTSPAVTPSPSPSPSPTVTVIPSPSPTLSPTPTTPPGQCPNGENGNLNCDTQGLINSLDLTILLGRWSPDGPVPTPFSGHHSADIVVDGKVNSLDLTKLLGHWKVE